MEPGLIDRDHWPYGLIKLLRLTAPQWSPVLSTGITGLFAALTTPLSRPQWSPVLSTGITPVPLLLQAGLPAAMEPGLIDRDHERGGSRQEDANYAAMEPGLIDRDHPDRTRPARRPAGAAMEPGLIDRDHPPARRAGRARGLAAMEPGLIDRVRIRRSRPVVALEVGDPPLPPARLRAWSYVSGEHEGRT